MAFGLRFADRIPAWRSAKRYASADDRCRACTLRGGREEPCESPQALKLKWVKRYGQRCPREDLWTENRVALRLAQLLLNEELRPMAPGYLADAGPENAEDRARLLMIVSAAMNDKRVRRERDALLERTSKRGGRNALDSDPERALPIKLEAVTVIDGKVGG